MKACTTPGCDRDFYGRGFCRTCYNREWRHGRLPKLTPTPLRERFYARVRQDPSGCWIWTGSTNNHGYGRLGVIYAHRISVELHHGPIPEGMDVMHLCDNPPCVNPDHLKPGTHAENMADAAAKGIMRNRKRSNYRGEAHHSTTLTWEQVREIRRRCADGLAQRAAARQYGVSAKAIWNIVAESTWKETAA